MKKFHVFIFVFLFMPLISCEQEEEIEILLSSNCNYDNRLTVKEVERIRGTVQLANQNIANQFIIVPNDPDLPNLSPCNLPVDLREEGRQIFFSGEIKEVYDNEKLASTPFKLTRIFLNK
jgi:hypothetical protein